MKAIVLHAYGPPENLRYEDAPDPAPKDGEVLVHVKATSINPIDWMHRSGAIHSFLPIQFPYIVGLDVAGTVDGKPVVGLTRSTYAELCVARRDDLVAIPDGVSFEDAATIPLVACTGETLMLRGAKPTPGDTIFVVGALGGVGRAAVFAAAEAGAKVIAGVRASRLDEARKLPGVIDAVALDQLAMLPALDAVAVAAPMALAPNANATMLAKLRPGGRFGCFLAARASVGEPPAGIEVNALNGIPNPETVARYVKAMAAGKFALPIAKTFPLAEAAAAHALAESGAGGKVVLRV